MTIKLKLPFKNLIPGMLKAPRKEVLFLLSISDKR